MVYFRTLHAGASVGCLECIEYTSHLSDWTYGILEYIKVSSRSRNLKKDKQYNDQEKGKNDKIWFTKFGEYHAPCK